MRSFITIFLLVTLGFFKIEMAAIPFYGINFNGLSSDLSGVRITNIHFDHTSHRGRDIYSNYNAPYNVACLVDHCRFEWDQSQDEPVFIHGANDAWSSAAPFGSGDVFFIEDCSFENGGGYTDFNNHATAVVRYCTIEDNKLDWHGAASNSHRGCRSGEVYGNVWTGTGSSQRIEIRGGAAIVWGNTNTDAKHGNLWIREYGKQSSQWAAFRAEYEGVSNNGGCGYW